MEYLTFNVLFVSGFQLLADVSGHYFYIVLQRINHLIFTNIEMLQHNIEVVTRHIRQKLEARHEEDIERKVLHFLPSTNGKTYFYDGEGYWRISIFIPRSQTLEKGLGSIIMTYPVGALSKMPEIYEMLQIPENRFFNCIIGFGYAEIPYARGVQREGIAQIKELTF